MKAVLISLELVISLSMSVYASTALAELQDKLINTRTKGSGWSGYLQVVAGGYSNKGLVSVGDDNEHINSFNATSRRSEEDFILPIWQLNYVLDETSTTLYFGVPDDSAFQNGIAFEAGISHEFADGTVLSTSYTPSISGLGGEVWQDPYLTGQKRKRSDTSTKAFHIEVENIFNSGFSFRHSFGENFVDEDHAGESLSVRLTTAQLNQLQRNGKFNLTQLSLFLPIDRYFYVIPELSYKHTDAKGDANSFNRIRGNLTLVYQRNQIEYFINGYFNKDRYEKPNPVFNIKRQDESYGLTLGASYREPLGWEDIKLELITGEARQDSSIHFFDTTGQFVALGLSYQF